MASVISWAFFNEAKKKKKNKMSHQLSWPRHGLSIMGNIQHGSPW